MTTKVSSFGWFIAVLVTILCGCNGANDRQANQNVNLLNVSYDPTREFYAEFNASFKKHWEADHAQTITIDQSHGGSGKQARAVIDGLEADIVTLALGYDIDAISQKSKLIRADWRDQFAHKSAPYRSTIVFLVRKGNPKGIRDWQDLIKPNIEVITPNPKTGGGARWNYLAAWGSAVLREAGSLEKYQAMTDEQKQAAHQKGREYVSELVKRVPIWDSAARGATNTFVQRELGDVLLTWENEAFLAIKDSDGAKVEIVVPSTSILAEPPVAVVDAMAAKHGTLEVAKAYLDHLYSLEGQQLAAKHFFRPVREEVLLQPQTPAFAKVQLFELESLFGSWDEAQKTHFNDGGIFDQLYTPK
ncbi:MAG: sulfate ABC transporter substrate-binding protein [Pirellulales bacterium]